MKTPFLIKLLLPYLILLSVQTKADFYIKEKSARSSALGGYSITLSDVWSQFNNQAGLASLDRIYIGISYSSPFQLKSLGIKSIGIILPVKKSVFGLNITQSGNTKLNQRNLGLAYGKKLNKHLYIGLQFNYFSLNQGNNLGSIQKINFEGGVIIHVDEKIKIGAHVNNPVLKSNNDVGLFLPEIYSFGFEYKIDNSLKSYFEMQHHSIFKGSLHLGLEYLSSFYSLRIGYSTNPDQLSFGIGINYKNFEMAISNTLHNNLGNTPQLSLLYKF